MAAPPQLRDVSSGGHGGLPSILIDRKPSAGFESRSSVGYSRYSSSSAMSIPGSEDHLVEVPPPLPPPRILPHLNAGPPEPYADAHREPHSMFPGESPMDRPDYLRRKYSKQDNDEGYESLRSASISSTSTRALPSLPPFGLSHSSFHFTPSMSSSIDEYDRGLKQKLNPTRTFSNKSPPRSHLSASLNETAASRRYAQANLAPLSMPTTLPLRMLDSPNRLTNTPINTHSALSPRSNGFNVGAGEYQPFEGSDLERSPRHQTWRNNSDPADDGASTQGSYEPEEMECEEPSSSSMRRLHLDDQQSASLKRRASSPAREEPMLHGVPSQSELLRRREVASRGSPTPRLDTGHHGSVSSTIPGSRAGSYASNFSYGTGITSINSYGRRSPNAMSPGGMSPVPTDPGCGSPYATSITLNPSPRASISRAPHQRTASQSQNLTSPRKLMAAAASKPTSTKYQGVLMCDCCPKKPKKFDTEEELRAHQSEKQYNCQFCGNRFKNKNEAERHQNSLHVRRHSWSCSSLQTYDQAFHESSNRPGEADTCGYCGEEFLRRGGSIIGGKVATQVDWDERIRHLTDVHKFRECNSSKKFYRADHFRQHLKHSHAGTSGKWTNMLENACMTEEDPPAPR